MKKIITIFKIFSLFIVFTLSINNAQVLNGGFENWTQGSPDNWLSVYFAFGTTAQSTNAHSGSFAITGSPGEFQGIVYPAYLQAGADGTGFSVSQRYASLSGFYQFAPEGGDQFFVNIILYNDNMPIAFGSAGLPAVSSYTQFNVQFEYASTDVPDNCYIQFAVADSSDENVAAHLGSSFLLDDVELSGEVPTSIKAVAKSIPDEFNVSQNYPNPFNPSTSIKYSLPEAVKVNAAVYDISGQKIADLIDENQNAGSYEISWDGKNNSGIPVVSGIYLFRIEAGNYSRTMKMTLLK